MGTRCNPRHPVPRTSMSQPLEPASVLWSVHLEPSPATTRIREHREPVAALAPGQPDGAGETLPGHTAETVLSADSEVCTTKFAGTRTRPMDGPPPESFSGDWRGGNRARASGSRARFQIIGIGIKPATASCNSREVSRGCENPTRSREALRCHRGNPCISRRGVRGAQSLAASRVGAITRRH